MRKFIKIDYTEKDKVKSFFPTEAQLELKTLNYGCILSNAENEFYICWSFGQQGRAKWRVVYTAADFSLETRSGECAYSMTNLEFLNERINWALTQLTAKWKEDFLPPKPDTTRH